MKLNEWMIIYFIILFNILRVLPKLEWFYYYVVKVEKKKTHLRVLAIVGGSVWAIIAWKRGQWLLRFPDQRPLWSWIQLQRLTLIKSNWEVYGAEKRKSTFFLSPVTDVLYVTLAVTLCFNSVSLNTRHSVYWFINIFGLWPTDRLTVKDKLR